MFQTCSRRRLAFHLRDCFILLYVLLPSFVSGAAKIYNKTDDYVRYHDIQESEEPKWELARLGKSGSDFLRIFFLNEASGAIRTAVQANISNYDKFIRSVIGYTFLQQIVMSIVVALGLLGVLLLLLMPFFLKWCRNRQTAGIDEAESDNAVASPRTGCLALEFIIVFLAATVFGGVLMCLSDIRFGSTLHEVFDFAAYSVQTSYNTKEIIIDSFYNNLFDVSRSALDTILLLYDVNDDIGRKFLDLLLYRVKPVLYLTESIQWDTTVVLNALKSDSERLSRLANSTDESLTKLSEEYQATLNELKSVFDKENAKDIFGLALDPILDVPSYTSASDKIATLYDKSIERLEDISKLESRTRLLNATHYLRNIIEKPNYDPSQLMEKLRKIAFDTEQNIRNVVGTYVAFIDVTFKEERRAVAINHVKSLRSKVLDGFKYLNVLILVFSILAAALAIFLCLMYCLGVIGTKGFHVMPSGENVLKSDLSHRSGKVIVVCLYLIVIFLAMFWALSIFIFLVSAVPLELCLATEDQSLFEVTVDHPIFQNAKNWYSMYSSRKFNFTLKSNIINCKRDASFFGPLRDPLINESFFEDIKGTLDTYPVHEKIESMVQNLTDIRITESEAATLNLENLLDIDIHSYFNNIAEFIRSLGNTSALVVLNNIKDNPKSSEKLSSAARTAIKSFETLMDTLSTTAADESAYSISLKAANLTMEMVGVQIENFNLSSDDIYNLIQNNATDMYMSVLNETVVEMIEGVQYNLDFAAREFRKTVSFCPILNLLYEKFLYITCERLLYPVAACWMGSFFVAIFFLLAVFVCLHTVPLFLKPPELSSSGVPAAVIRADDIPTRTEDVSRNPSPEEEACAAEMSEPDSEEDESSTDSASNGAASEPKDDERFETMFGQTTASPESSDKISVPSAKQDALETIADRQSAEDATKSSGIADEEESSATERSDSVEEALRAALSAVEEKKSS